MFYVSTVLSHVKMFLVPHWLDFRFILNKMLKHIQIFLFTVL